MFFSTEANKKIMMDALKNILQESSDDRKPGYFNIDIEQSDKKPGQLIISVYPNYVEEYINGRIKATTKANPDHIVSEKKNLIEVLETLKIKAKSPQHTLASEGSIGIDLKHLKEAYGAGRLKVPASEKHEPPKTSADKAPKSAKTEFPKTDIHEDELVKTVTPALPKLQTPQSLQSANKPNDHSTGPDTKDRTGRRLK